MRDVVGAMHGSRWVETEQGAALVERVLAHIAGDAPVLVEVGFDHGRRLSATARLNPDWRVLGLEVRRRRVEQATERARRDGRTNVLACRIDARTLFAVLPAASVDVVEALFPDPWVKPAHRRRRLLVTEAFLADVARALRPDGRLLLATDVERYAEEMRRCLTQTAALTEVAVEEVERPACDQQSRRQWRCEQDGTPVHWLAARRG